MQKLISILNNNQQVDEWRIIENNTHSTELFFIKEKLQMNRAKDVDKIVVSLYTNFEEDGKKLKGSSTVKLNPTDSVPEIEKKIEQAILAASFVKNEYYPLPMPTDKKAPKIESKFADGDVVDTISEIVKEMYDQDNKFGAFINSAEFFINSSEIRIINSNGIDVAYNSYKAEIEVITEAVGEKENIELFSIFDFSDFDREAIKETILEQLEYTALRAKAVPLPKIDNVPVIFNGKAIEGFWDFYLFNSAASQKYDHLHENNVGDNIQGDDVVGDRVTVDLVPVIPNSYLNSYYDQDGLYTNEVRVIEAGILKRLYADTRYAHYLNIEPTGRMRNSVIQGGQYTIKELRKPPYLEVVSFSAFQMEPMTGFFGGEFRLAIYNDGEKEIPVTLGTVTGNMNDAQKAMFFSKETVQNGHYISPRLIKFKKMTIAGS